MFIKTAKQLDDLLKKESELDCEMLTNMHLQQIKFFMDNKKVKLSDEKINEAIGFIEDQFNIVLTQKEFKEIMDLFPLHKITFVVYEEDSALMDMVFNFFAGCETPTYGDKINEDNFLTYVIEQAKKMGYKTN